MPDGSVSKVPAIDAHWARTPLALPPFLPSDSTTGAVDQALDWVELRAAMSEGLDALLRAPFAHFWSRVLHDEGVVRFVDSMLRFAPRHFELEDDATADEPAAEDEELRRKCLLLLVRLGSARESASEFIAEEHWGQLVYDRRAQRE
jgi:activating signal cointegrator complex subunit 2